MITKKTGRNCERRERERECQRRRERKRGKSSERKQKEVLLRGVTKRVKYPLNPINNSQRENPFENPRASAP